MIVNKLDFSRTWKIHNFRNLGQNCKFSISLILLRCKKSSLKFGKFRFSILVISWSLRQRLIRVEETGVRFDIFLKLLSNNFNVFNDLQRCKESVKKEKIKKIKKIKKLKKIKKNRNSLK